MYGPVIGNPKYFDYVTLHSFTMPDKLKPLSYIYNAFHRFRKVMISELLTNGMAIYLFTNQSYEGFKIAAAFKYLDFFFFDQIIWR